MEKSQKYAVHYIEEAKIKEEGVEIGKVKGEKNKAIEIAKKLVKNGVGIEIICKSTGISKMQITKLSKTKKKG